MMQQLKNYRFNSFAFVFVCPEGEFIGFEWNLNSVKPRANNKINKQKNKEQQSN